MAVAHAQQVAALEARLAWYVDNQELLGANDGLVAEQADVIRQLQARLGAMEAPGGVSHRKRIKELEEQVGWGEGATWLVGWWAEPLLCHCCVLCCQPYSFTHINGTFTPSPPLKPTRINRSPR